VEEALHTFTIPIAWEIFRNMTREDDVKTLTYNLNPSESEGEEEKWEDDEETREAVEKTKTKKEEPKTRKEETQTEEEKHETKKDKTIAEKKKETRTKGKRTKIERNKNKSPKIGTMAEREETKQEEEEIKTGIEETKLAEAKKTKADEIEAPKVEVSPETQEMEATNILAKLNTAVKPKPKRKMQPSMYFKARKSTRINKGKPHPPSKEPITIEDSPTAKKEETPSRTPITYERGSPRSSTWRERI